VAFHWCMPFTCRCRCRCRLHCCRLAVWASRGPIPKRLKVWPTGADPALEVRLQGSFLMLKPVMSQSPAGLTKIGGQVLDLNRENGISAYLPTGPGMKSRGDSR